MNAPIAQIMLQQKKEQDEKYVDFLIFLLDKKADELLELADGWERKRTI